MNLVQTSHEIIKCHEHTSTELTPKAVFRFMFASLLMTLEYVSKVLDHKEEGTMQSNVKLDHPTWSVCGEKMNCRFDHNAGLLW